LLFRPGTDHLIETIILIGIVASSTFGGMKLASWVESKQYNLKG
jgi:Na+(H+)/acetate symporter ActP